MKIFVSIAIFAMPAMVWASAIPKTYHGEWLESEEPPQAQTCVDNDVSLKINAKQYYGYEFSCSVKKVTAKNDKAIVVSLLCSNEMGDYKGTVILNINKKKQLEVVGQGRTAIYYPCPKKTKK